MALRVGIIGLGLIGDIQVNAFQNYIDEAEVVAVCDVNEATVEACAERYGVAGRYAEGEQLISDNELDLLVVSTPPESHHRYTLAGLDRGFHILCEKPMAMNAHQAREMLEAAQRAEVVHMIDHELRFNGNRARIRSMIEAGLLKTPWHASFVSIDNQLVGAPWTWWSTQLKGGGALGEFASHSIDLFRWWLGDIRDSYGEVHTFITERETETGERRSVDSDDYATFVLQFENGARGQITTTGVGGHPGYRHLEIHGSGGAIVLEKGETLLAYEQGTAEPDEKTEPEPIDSLVGMKGDIWSPAFVRLAKHLVAAIQDGAPAEPAANFEDGLRVQEVLDSIRGA